MCIRGVRSEGGRERLILILSLVIATPTPLARFAPSPHQPITTTELGPNFPPPPSFLIPKRYPPWPNTEHVCLGHIQSRKESVTSSFIFALCDVFPILFKALIHSTPLHSTPQIFKYLSFLPHIPLIVLCARTRTCNNRATILHCHVPRRVL